MPVSSSLWSSWLPRGQVSSMGTSTRWGDLQQCPHGCSAVGKGSSNSLSKGLEKELMNAAGLGELMRQGIKNYGAPRAVGAWHVRQDLLRLWGWDCPSGLLVASPRKL